MIEMKISVESINSRVDLAEKRISELKVKF
jgi:hypothetical protein